MSVSVCLRDFAYVPVSVSEHTRISGTTHPIFTERFSCNIWLWFGPLAALRYVMYFRLYG